MASLSCFPEKSSIIAHRSESKVAGMSSILALLSAFDAIVDYGHKGTTPVPGESLSLGWLSRWYGYRLLCAAFEVSFSSFNFFL